MPCAPHGPSNRVGSENVATNEEVGPDAVALSTFFDLYPDQQEAYEESVAKGQIDVANCYRAQAGLEALSTKSTPFRFRGSKRSKGEALSPFLSSFLTPVSTL
jgi:hypothetical protein